MFAGRSVEAISYDRYLRIPAGWSSTQAAVLADYDSRLVRDTPDTL